MGERIAYSVEDYSYISENDCKIYQNMFNSEFPTAIDRATIEYAKRRLLTLDDSIKIFTARVITSNDTKLVGIGIVRQSEKEDFVPWLSMVIDRNYQRKGIGAVLVDKAKEYYDKLHGWCTPADGYEREDGSIYPSPLKFYKKHGFKIIKDKVDYVDGLDLVEIAWSKEIEN
ncbi:MAG: GNAT family N-acetyltransferase [Candidatus Heimdallarchaeota archaeon]|nr:GNAT family N-acetyltransferase [Candidatus Heimdallarchaeota archaeon]